MANKFALFTGTNGKLDSEDQVTAGLLTNTSLNSSAAIAYSKLSLAGAVTNADLAGGIVYSKLSLTGAILNADLAGSIAYSKLSLTGAILNADLAGSIAYGKLSLTGAIVNDDLAGSIAYSKLALTGAILNADLAGSIADSKLSTISTPGKVDNAATTATSSNTVSTIVARDASGNFSANIITLGGSPSSALQAATKGYVDSIAQGLDVKHSVRAATDGTFGQFASLTIGSGAAGILFYNNRRGSNGNSNQIAFINGGASQALAVTVSGSDPGATINVALATDGASAITSTANDVIAAVNAHGGASAIVIASAVGAGTGVVSAAAATNLANGYDLAGAAPGTIDGVLLSLNDRVLVKDLDYGRVNGIYVVSSLGTGAADDSTWERATDMDASAEISAGSFVFVEEGTLYADTGWVLSTDGVITLDTTDLEFTQFSSAGVIEAGQSLEKSGNIIGVSNGGIGETQLAFGAVTADKIGAGAVVEAKLGSSAVTEAKIANLAVTEGKLATDSVTENKIASGAVVAAKIGAGAVVEAKLGAGAVTADKIGSDAVTTVKILDSNVTTAKIADSNVTTAKIADANVTTAKIADANVTFAKLADVFSTSVGKIGGDTPSNAATSLGTILSNPTSGVGHLIKVKVSANVGGTAFRVIEFTVPFLRVIGTDVMQFEGDSQVTVHAGSSSMAAIVAECAIEGTNVVLRVTGLSATGIKWNAYYETVSAIQPA